MIQMGTVPQAVCMETIRQWGEKIIPRCVRPRRREAVAMASYEAVYRRSIEDPEGFWREAAEAIDWEVAPGDRILDRSREPFYRWFPGARLNTCYNLLDRHVDGGRGEQAALIYDSPVTVDRRGPTPTGAARRGRPVRRRARGSGSGRVTGSSSTCR